MGDKLFLLLMLLLKTVIGQMDIVNSQVETGYGQMEAGNGPMETRNGQMEAGNGPIETGIGHVEAGNGPMETGNGQMETGSSQTTTISTNEMEAWNKVEGSPSTDTLQPSESTVVYSIINMDDINRQNENPSSVETMQNTDPLDAMAGMLDKEVQIIEQALSNKTNVTFYPENEPIAAPSNDQYKIQLKDDSYSEFTPPSIPTINFEETKENPENSGSPSAPSEFPNGQVIIGNSNPDISPVLQLTEGGYQRPFQAPNQFRDQQQRLKFDSATQQSERVKNPNSNFNSGERSGRARIPLQVPYSSIFQQPPFAYTPSPIFRHPFTNQINGARNSPGIQNSFYNTQPDFTQGQFSQIDTSGGFPAHFAMQTAPRNPLQNPDYLFQAPFHISTPQTLPVNTPGHAPEQFFHHNNGPGYPRYENSMDPMMEYMTLLGNGPMNSPFQEKSNSFGSTSNFGRNSFPDPNLNFVSNFPNTDAQPQFRPKLFNSPPTAVQQPIKNMNREEQNLNSPNYSLEKADDELREDPNRRSSPFGTRISQENNGQEKSATEKQENVYIRYPMKEAGYATEDNLPPQNDTEKGATNSNIPPKDIFPFFSPPRYNVYNSPDPYKAALENIQGGYLNGMNPDDKNQTDEFKFGQRVKDIPLGEGRLSQTPPNIFPRNPERNPVLTSSNTPFYVNPDRNPFEPFVLFPDNSFQYPGRPPMEDNKVPTCAEKTNSSICFEDTDYPRGDLLYALNSDSYLMERLAMNGEELDGIPLVEQNTTETPKSEDNYICKSDIKYGLPLRAQNIQGKWKVIVNIERAVGMGKFIQPVRMEECRGAGEPCNFTQIKTACVQKYSLQRLLSWSQDRGVHNDVFKLPVACSCQIIEANA